MRQRDRLMNQLLQVAKAYIATNDPHILTHCIRLDKQLCRLMPYAE